MTRHYLMRLQTIILFAVAAAAAKIISKAKCSSDLFSDCVVLLETHKDI